MKIFYIAALALISSFIMIHDTYGADKTAHQMVQEAKASIKEITAAEAYELIKGNKKIVILDVQDSDEYAIEHLSGALNISRGTLEFKAGLQIPDKGQEIIVYCGTDRRSPLATRTLNDMGYKKAVNMKGGLPAWKAAGYAVETSAKPVK